MEFVAVPPTQERKRKYDSAGIRCAIVSRGTFGANYNIALLYKFVKGNLY